MMDANQYVRLLAQYVSGQVGVETFIGEFHCLFESEINPNPRWVFDILQDLFEDIDAYSPMWTELDVNEFRITENILKQEATKALQVLQVTCPPGSFPAETR